LNLSENRRPVVIVASILWVWIHLGRLFSSRLSSFAGPLLVLADTLQRIARVQNLLKLGGAFGGDQADIDITLQTRSPDAPRLTGLNTLPVPRLVPDDEVHVLACNNELLSVDLNVLYIGSDYSITHMFAGRLQPGDRLKQGLLRITDAAFGRDRVVMILTPAKPHTAIEDLSFLQQDELPATRGVGDAGFAGMLAEAGFGARTRAAAPLGGGSDTGPGPAVRYRHQTGAVAPAPQGWCFQSRPDTGKISVHRAKIRCMTCPTSLA
jgi:hypothetical protein